MPSFEGREERIRGDNQRGLKRSEVGLKASCELAIV